jgi:nucleoside-diphosphate-sugar epimerase
MQRSALVVGASGIGGRYAARELLAHGWTVFGLARRPPTDLPGLIPVAADLLDPASLSAALAEHAPTHVFITTWMRQDSELDNIRVNAGMVRNLLDALSPKKSVRHVALVTGLKHYLGPFEAYASTGTLPDTPLRESQPRLPLENFYYAQEDEVYAAAERDRFTWTVHRPHSIIGLAVGNAMNMGTTLAVYASICKETGQPFQFPGSEAQWNGLSDVTDARMLAKQLRWAADTDAARNEFPLELAVAPAGGLVRRAGGGLQRHGPAPGSNDGERSRRLARDRRQAQAARAGSRPPGVRLAHGSRPRPAA